LLIYIITTGIIARTLTAPQDRIAINMRAYPSHSNMMTLGLSLVKKGGIRSLWVGNGVNCVKDGPRSGILFTSYQIYKKHLIQDPNNPRLLESFVCGALAGATSVTGVYPLFVVQARMASAEKGRYNGILDCLKKTIRAEGVRGLLRGYDAAVGGIALERGLSMMVYLQLQNMFSRDGTPPSVAQNLCYGAVGALFAQSITAPAQVVMVRTMVQGESMGMPVVYNNAFDCFHKILYGAPSFNIRAEGFRALFRGLPVQLLKTVPGTAIQFAGFDYFSKQLRPLTG
jgi:hypothetical protein